MFEGVDPPDEIEQIVMLVFASKQTYQTIGGGRIVLVSELLEDIFADLKTKRLAASAITEHLVILRSFQFVTEYRATIMQVWKSVPDGKEPELRDDVATRERGQGWEG